MKTLLLLAGRSRRFWPLREKSFFPICGKTLIEEQVRRLQVAGCKEIVLIGGKHNLKDAKKLFRKLKCIEQKNLDLGMQGALLSSLPFCKKESVMIVSANDVIDAEAYRELIEEEKRVRSRSRDEAFGVILARKVKKYFPGGYLTVKGSRAVEIVEKPGEGKEPSNLVNIVAHVHSDASVLLKELKNIKTVGARHGAPQRDDAYEQALGNLMKNLNYKIVRYDGFWQAVKYPWHLLALLPHFLGEITTSSRGKNVSVHRTAVVEGNVVLEEGVRVLPHATIVGPSYIGRNTIIGTGALVRGASIGERCVIGFGTEVKTSVLAHDVWTHMAYAGDSVIGSNVALAGGVMTGNLRLDEGEIFSAPPSPAGGGVGGGGKEKIPTGLTKFGAIIGSNCRIGIHVGTNPGVKIGEGSFIGGGSFLTEDIPDESFVTIKDGKLVIRPNRSEVLRPEARNQYRK